MRDQERLTDLLLRRADVYAKARSRPGYYGDDDIDLLRALFDRESDANAALMKRCATAEAEVRYLRDLIVQLYERVRE